MHRGDFKLSFIIIALSSLNAQLQGNTFSLFCTKLSNSFQQPLSKVCMRQFSFIFAIIQHLLLNLKLIN